MAERTLTTNQGEVHVTTLNAHGLRKGTTFVGLDGEVEVVQGYQHLTGGNGQSVEVQTESLHEYSFGYNEPVPVVVGGQVGGGMRGGSR